MKDLRDYLCIPDTNPLSPGNGSVWNPKAKKKLIKVKKKKI